MAALCSDGRHDGVRPNPSNALNPPLEVILHLVLFSVLWCFYILVRIFWGSVFQCVSIFLLVVIVFSTYIVRLWAPCGYQLVCECWWLRRTNCSLLERVDEHNELHLPVRHSEWVAYCGTLKSSFDNYNRGPHIAKFSRDSGKRLLSHHTVEWGVFNLLCVCHFVCTVTDFSAAEKGSSVKFCLRVRLLSAMTFFHFAGQRSKVKVTRNKKRA